MFILSCVLTFILSSALVLLLHILCNVNHEVSNLRMHHIVAQNAYDRRKRLYHDKNLTATEKFYELMAPLS